MQHLPRDPVLGLGFYVATPFLLHCVAALEDSAQTSSDRDGNDPSIICLSVQRGCPVPLCPQELSARSFRSSGAHASFQDLH